MTFKSASISGSGFFIFLKKVKSDVKLNTHTHTYVFSLYREVVRLLEKDVDVKHFFKELLTAFSQP
jgi:hypothetical protein